MSELPQSALQLLETAAEREAMEWLRPRIERLAESVVARVDEWWESHVARE
jgi:hypothetical protein